MQNKYFVKHRLLILLTLQALSGSTQITGRSLLSLAAWLGL